MATIKENALYLCDNGRCVCGKHLGHSARTTGRDVSGQRIYQIKPQDCEVGQPPFRCETCRATFGRSVKQGIIRNVLVRDKVEGKRGATIVLDYGS